MGKRNKKKQKIEVNQGAAATNNPFAAALSGMSAPEAELDLEVAGESPLPVAAIPPVRTRVERKGRGGKTVTLVTGLESLSESKIEDLASRLARALGTGVSNDEGELVVQGDLRKRVEAWFDKERGS